MGLRCLVLGLGAHYPHHHKYHCTKNHVFHRRNCHLSTLWLACRGHTRAINISRDSPPGCCPYRIGLSPWWDNPVKKNVSMASNSMSRPWIMNFSSVGFQAQIISSNKLGWARRCWVRKNFSNLHALKAFQHPTLEKSSTSLSLWVRSYQKNAMMSCMMRKNELELCLQILVHNLHKRIILHLHRDYFSNCCDGTKLTVHFSHSHHENTSYSHDDRKVLFVNHARSSQTRATYLRWPSGGLWLKNLSKLTCLLLKCVRKLLKWSTRRSLLTW